MAEVAIKVQDLQVSFGDLEVLKGISFDVKQGEIFVVLGGSGCGKSTLVRHMVGLRKPQNGSVHIFNEDIVAANVSEKFDILNNLGVMFQSGALFGSMSLLENVRLPLEEKTDLPITLMNAVARYKLELVGLGKFTDYLPDQISGGMQKRAAIARAMSLDPRILFLDEPSAGLDPITSASLDELILRLTKTFGMTFVVVSHELPSIFTIADRIIMLQDGVIIAEGDPKELKESSDDEFVKQFFSRQTQAVES